MFSFCQREKINTRKSNQELINSKEYQLKSPPTQNLKLLFFLLQNHSDFRSVLAKISVIKQVNCHYSWPFTPFVLSVLKNKTCILHHIAFLVWLPTHYFLRPTTHFQPLKNHFLTTISPFSAMFSQFERFLFIPQQCIFMLFTLRLAAYCTAFCSKTHAILLEMAKKLVQTALF